MRSKRYLSFFVLFVVFVMSGVAIYIGMTLQNQPTSPKNSKAYSVSTGCKNPTTENPLGGDPSPYEYCSGKTGIWQVLGEFPAGQYKLSGYCVIAGADQDPTAPGSCTFLDSFVFSGTSVPISALGDFVTKPASSSVQIGPGSEFLLQAQFKVAPDNQPYALGWIPAQEDGTCVNGGDMNALIAKVKADGREIASIQCWADQANTNSMFDFNDFFLIIAYDPPVVTPTEEATPTPTDEATPTPTESGSPTTTPTGTRNPTATPTRNSTPTATSPGTRAPTNTARPTIPAKITKLPPTAIVDDRTDTIIFGVLIIIVGIVLSNRTRSAKFNP
jgi:hypothetical protein